MEQNHYGRGQRNEFNSMGRGRGRGQRPPLEVNESLDQIAETQSKDCIKRIPKIRNFIKEKIETTEQDLLAAVNCSLGDYEKRKRI